MSRPKIARKSTSIDMTAMCDVAFLLLSFFISFLASIQIVKLLLLLMLFILLFCCWRSLREICSPPLSHPFLIRKLQLVCWNRLSLQLFDTFPTLDPCVLSEKRELLQELCFWFHYSVKWSALLVGYRHTNKGAECCISFSALILTYFLHS